MDSSLTGFETYTERAVRLAQEYTNRTTRWDCLWTLLLVSCHDSSMLETVLIAEALDEMGGKPA